MPASQSAWTCAASRSLAAGLTSSRCRRASHGHSSQQERHVHGRADVARCANRTRSCGVRATASGRATAGPSCSGADQPASTHSTRAPRSTYGAYSTPPTEVEAGCGVDRRPVIAGVARMIAVLTVSGSARYHGRPAPSVRPATTWSSESRRPTGPRGTATALGTDRNGPVLRQAYAPARTSPRPPIRPAARLHPAATKTAERCRADQSSRRELTSIVMPLPLAMRGRPPSSTSGDTAATNGDSDCRAVQITRRHARWFVAAGSPAVKTGAQVRAL